MDVCMYVCMYVGHASALMVGQILFIISIQECILPKLMLGESEHSSSKNNGPQNTK
jgi:hypothetical protein